MTVLTTFKNTWLLKILFFSLISLTIITLIDVHFVESHVPYMALDENETLEKALALDEIQISKVIYQILNESAEQSWITFEGKSGQILHLEIGLPALEQVRDFRPTIVLIEPSDPNHSPIELTQSYVSTDGARLTPFHEPFTDTNSWVLTKREISLTETGRYYLVSLDEEKNTGKLWVAIGKEERFGMSDIASLPSSIWEVRKFHENRENGKSSPWTHKFFLLLLVLLIAIGTVGLSILVLKLKKSN